MLPVVFYRFVFPVSLSRQEIDLICPPVNQDLLSQQQAFTRACTSAGKSDALEVFINFVQLIYVKWALKPFVRK